MHHGLPFKKKRKKNYTPREFNLHSVGALTRFFLRQLFLANRAARVLARLPSYTALAWRAFLISSRFVCIRAPARARVPPSYHLQGLFPKLAEFHGVSFTPWIIARCALNCLGLCTRARARPSCAFFLPFSIRVVMYACVQCVRIASARFGKRNCWQMQFSRSVDASV